MLFKEALKILEKFLLSLFREDSCLQIDYQLLKESEVDRVLGKEGLGTLQILPVNEEPFAEHCADFEISQKEDHFSFEEFLWIKF